MMQYNGVLGKLRARFGGKRRWSLLAAAVQMLDRFLYAGAEKNRAAPFVRDGDNVQRIYTNFVIASLPCWLIGLWNVGYQSNLALANTGAVVVPGWRGSILSGLGITPQSDNIIACFLQGLLHFLPLFLLVLLVATFWNTVFSVLRRRTPDEGTLAFAWLFTLALPAAAAPVEIVLGASFGLVIGKHIYGGSGFHLISPVVVGLVFLWLAYPSAVFVAQSADGGGSWLSLFIGARAGGMGTTSVLGCVIGAAYLLATAAASWRIMTGALLGLGLTLQLLGMTGPENLAELSLTGTLVSGGLAFGIVFLATDPVAASMTNAGRWLYGVGVGVLAVILQQGNAAVGDSVLFAIFVASLLAPLMDTAVIALHKKRRRQRFQGVLDG